MKKNDIKNKIRPKSSLKRIFMFTSIFIITYFIILTTITPNTYDLKSGDIAEIDIKAPRDIIDTEATSNKEEEVRKNVEKVYSLIGEVKNTAIENSTELFTKVINLKSSELTEKEKIAELKKIETFKLSDSYYTLLINLTSSEATEMQWTLLGALNNVYDNNIGEDGEQYITDVKTIDDVKEIASTTIEASGLEVEKQRLLKAMAYAQIKPNFVFDVERTNEKITEALKNIPKEMIKKNQIIVSEGEPITEKQIEILDELGLLNKGVDSSYLLTYITLAIYVMLILVLQYIYIKKERKNILENNKIISMLGLLNIIFLIIALGANIVSPFVIPIACIPLIMTALLDYKLSLVINILNMALISIVVGFNSQIIILGLVSIIIASMSVKKMGSRTDILYSTIYIGIGGAIVVLSTSLINTNNFVNIITNVTFTIVGALLSGILAMGITPFLETGFEIITNIKLLELANPNSPLLKRILMEAPGTYHHSLMVANLAEVAAEEVDANPVLARVGAYYHDVGKLRRPMFFGENQNGIENPHNKMSPDVSAKIIISHAKDGLDLAKEYKLPTVIQDLIIQHHGTTLVKYFYFTLKNSLENPEQVKESEFRYDGPIPSTKEAAIIMLADSVEAAVRSIKAPTKEKIEEMVNNIIKDKLHSEQLNDTDLTLKDLEKIKQSFLTVLNGVYHQRVEYPEEKKKN